MSRRTLGIAGVNDRSAGLLALNFNSAVVSGIGSGNIGTQQLFANTVFQIGDTFLASYRTHVIHAGFQVTKRYLNTFYAGNNGRTGFMTYAGKYTAGPELRRCRKWDRRIRRSRFLSRAADRIGPRASTPAPGDTAIPSTRYTCRMTGA